MVRHTIGDDATPHNHKQQQGGPQKLPKQLMRRGGH